jgi:hypothetical protein
MVPGLFRKKTAKSSQLTQSANVSGKIGAYRPDGPREKTALNAAELHSGLARLASLNNAAAQRLHANLASRAVWKWQHNAIERAFAARSTTAPSRPIPKVPLYNSFDYTNRNSVLGYYRSLLSKDRETLDRMRNQMARYKASGNISGAMNLNPKIESLAKYIANGEKKLKNASASGSVPPRSLSMLVKMHRHQQRQTNMAKQVWCAEELAKTQKALDAALAKLHRRKQ